MCKAQDQGLLKSCKDFKSQQYAFKIFDLVALTSKKALAVCAFCLVKTEGFKSIGHVSLDRHLLGDPDHPKGANLTPLLIKILQGLRKT